MKIRACLGFGFAVWCASPAANAQTVVAANLLSGGISTANATMLWGQTFQPTASGILWNIEFLAQQNIYPIPATFTVQLYSVVSLAPLTLVPITSAAGSTSAITGQGIDTWLTASFGSQSIFLAQAQSYAFVMSYDTSNNNFLTFLGAAGYPSGDMIASTDSGLSFFVHPTNSDLTFRVTAVPEPGTHGLLALATLGLAIWQRRRRTQRA